jgi:hypothetical protein
MRRAGAFFVHLAISAAIFGALVALIVFVWYPDFFFEADGGWQGIRIVMLVDLVAGPLLTLIVYKPGKPNLRMDLTLIALFQAICLIGGTWVVYDERPLALVYSDGKFFSMTASDFEEAKLDPALLTGFPGPWPKRIAVELPADPLIEGTIRREAIQADRPIRTLSEYYVPLTRAALHADREAIAPAALEGLDRDSRELPDWLARHGGTVEDYAFFNFATRYHYAFLGVRRGDGELVGMLRTQGEL